MVFEVQVEAARARAELAALGKAHETMGGSMERVAGNVERLRAKQLELAQALATAGNAVQKDAVLIGALRKELESTTATLNSFGASQARVTQGMRGAATATAANLNSTATAAQRIQRTMGPAAAAVQGFSGAMGDGSSTAGKFLGVGAQLGSAFMGGGKIGLGIAAGAIAFGFIKKKIDEAEEATRSYKAASEEMAQAIVDASNTKLKSFSDRLEEMRKGLQNMGMATGEQLVRDLKNQAAKDEAELADNERRLEVQRERAAEAQQLASNTRGRAFDERAADEQRTLANLETRVTSLRESVAALKGQIPGAELSAFSERSLAKLNEKPSGMGASTRLGPGENVAPASMEEWLPFSKWAQQEKAQAEQVALVLVDESGPMGQARRETLSFYDEAAQAAELSTARQQMMWDNLGVAIGATFKDLHGEMASLAQGSFSVLTGVAQGYFDALITGEEHAAEMAAASALRGIGEQLVGFGTQATFKGAGYLIESAGLDPRGYGMLGLGAAAIGAGMGMGAAGTAVAHTASGGAVGHALPDANKERGVNQGRGSSSGGNNGSGEGRSYHFHYGVAGPQPDETARAFARINARADARGFSDSAIVVTR